MQRTIQLEAKVFGNKRTIIKRSLELRSLGPDPTLASLIRAVVEVEVEAFEDRHEQRTFVRLLTEAQLQEQAESGRVETGRVETGPASNPTAQADLDEAVEVALLAFRDGLYIVLVDDEELHDLDSPVQLGDASTVMFIRLVAIARGW